MGRRSGREAIVPTRLVTASAFDHLSRVVQRLTVATGRKDVIDAIITVGMADFGATSVGVFLLSADRTHVELAAHDRVNPDVVAMFPIPMDLDVPVTDAIRSGEPVWIDTQSQRDRWYPLIKESEVAVESSGMLPIEGRDGPVGALGVGFAADHLFSEIERRYTTALAGLCALGLGQLGLGEDP
jgi:GAF domain-containing protein